MPPRYEQGSSEAQFHSTAKDLFRQVYFEVIDLAVSSINRAGVTGPAARFSKKKLKRKLTETLTCIVIVLRTQG